MKITKTYLKKLIREEIGGLEDESDEQQPEQPKEDDWDEELKAKHEPKPSPFDEKSYWDEEKNWRGFEPQESEEEIRERDTSYAKISEYLETLGSKIDATSARVDRVMATVQKQLQEIKEMFGQEAASAEDEDAMFEKEYEKEKQKEVANEKPHAE